MRTERAPRRSGRADREDLSASSRELIAVALGGNVGTHTVIVGRFRAAVRLLRVAGAFDVRPSSVYWSSPAGPVRKQPPFLNAVVGFRLPREFTPMDLLLHLWSIEASLGRARPRRPKQGPRTLDLDMLVFGERTEGGPTLTLPHPRIGERPFVRRPLAEILDPEGEREPDDAECRRVGGPELLTGARPVVPIF